MCDEGFRKHGWSVPHDYLSLSLSLAVHPLSPSLSPSVFLSPSLSLSISFPLSRALSLSLSLSVSPRPYQSLLVQSLSVSVGFSQFPVVRCCPSPSVSLSVSVPYMLHCFDSKKIYIACARSSDPCLLGRNLCCSPKHNRPKNNKHYIRRLHNVGCRHEIQNHSEVVVSVVFFS